MHSHRNQIKYTVYSESVSVKLNSIEGAGSRGKSLV